MIRSARLSAIGGLALLAMAGSALAQPAAPAPAAPAKIVGVDPAKTPEILEAVRECVKVTIGAARIDFRHLRDNGWKIGGRSFQPSTEAKPESGNGDLVFVFGRGNTLLSTRLSPAQARCRIAARVESAGELAALRTALIEGKVAMTFDAAPGHQEFKATMRKRLPDASFENVLLSEDHVFMISTGGKPEQQSLLIDVWALSSRAKVAS